METGWLLPDLDDEVARGFWQGCEAGELRVQGCKQCGRLRMPPRLMCPECRSLESKWVPVSGEGKIWSFVVPHPPLLPAFAELAPYPVVTVELRENSCLRMVGNLVVSADAAVNEVDPSTIEIGDPVRVVFARVEDVYLPRWTGAKWQT